MRRAGDTYDGQTSRHAGRLSSGEASGEEGR